MEVIYEDNHLIAVNKECGEITQGDKTGDVTLPDKLKSWIAKKYQKQGNVFLGVIHRLDRPTSGVVVFSKTSKALARMNRMFKERDVQKKYWAIVEKRPDNDEGSLTNFLRKNKKQNKSYVSQPAKDAKEATLKYRVLDEGERYFLLEILPKTGRHHQIRTQLSHIGCCIKGDVKYGAKRANADKGISLHARKIVFIHPVSKEEVSIEAPVPDDSLWQWFEKRQAH